MLAEQMQNPFQQNKLRSKGIKYKDPSSVSLGVTSLWWISSYWQCLSHKVFGWGGLGVVINCRERYICTSIWRSVVALSGGPAIPSERVSDPAGDAVGNTSHNLAKSMFFQFSQAHVVLQLLRGHVNVPSVPEHPPDQAEEDDNGPSINEQIVDNQASKHPHHHDEYTEYVMGHCEPERALAAANSSIPPLCGWVYLYRCWHSGSGDPPNQKLCALFNPDLETGQKQQVQAADVLAGLKRNPHWLTETH